VSIRETGSYIVLFLDGDGKTIGYDEQTEMLAVILDTISRRRCVVSGRDFLDSLLP
jgi:hypothetical protein